MSGIEKDKSVKPAPTEEPKKTEQYNAPDHTPENSDTVIEKIQEAPIVSRDRKSTREQVENLLAELTKSTDHLSDELISRITDAVVRRVARENGSEEERTSAEIAALLFKGFKTGKMPLPVFYFYPEKWAAVCNAEDYPLQEKALGILRTRTGDMLEIVTPDDSEKLRIYDFGVGTGQKGEIILNKAIERNGRHIEYHGVDASQDMLKIAMVQMAKHIVQEALELKKAPRKVRCHSKWKQLIQFIRKFDLEYSTLQSEHLNFVFTRIFKRHCTNPEGKESEYLLKFFIARMLRLRRTDIRGKRYINELDHTVDLPLSMYAHPQQFQTFTKAEFEPQDKEGVVIFDLGSEICNQFPGKSLAMFYDLLIDPETPNHEDGIVPLEDEKNVQTNYAVLGLQLGEIPTSKRQFREMRSKMRIAYNNPAFRALTEHPFLRDDVTYIDLATGEEVHFQDIGFIYVDYEEDPEHPGYYMSTHRLYITEDVEIINALGEKTTIYGRSRAHDVFEQAVDALFDPDREEELGGRRNEILNRCNVSTKEELLAAGPQMFFSRDYSNYGNGIKIAEEILEEPSGLQETLLYPSYKPSLKQIVSLHHQNGLKIIDVYSDNEENPSYVKILSRRMTPEEKDLFDSDTVDPDIFYQAKE
ncbi:hypothetical protein GF369_02170 [Candidatus Peregrinibacteria bacterium]|nr:hypothetical protein [Candidatus Peregrinibacteria bacterium]